MSTALPLDGRNIVVTGASSGIGRELCHVYAENGAAVWAVARDAERLAGTVADAPAGVAVAAVAADLTHDDGPPTVAAALGGERVDVVVHAAGILGPRDTLLADYPADEWDEVMAINLTAVQRLYRALGPAVPDDPASAIIGVSSTVGREARAGWGAYAISKHALEAWLDTVALEWRGRVYSVNPGATRTPMRAAAAPDEDPTTIPSPRDISPIFLRLAHRDCQEPSGMRLDARDSMGTDPFAGLGH